MKSCSCGRSISAPEWDALSLVGNQLDGDGMLELKNCACGSTLAIELPMGPGAWVFSAATHISCARRDINESAPYDALYALKRAREQLNFAIRQLEGCVKHEPATSAQAAE